MKKVAELTRIATAIRLTSGARQTGSAFRDDGSATVTTIATTDPTNSTATISMPIVIAPWAKFVAPV